MVSDNAGLSDFSSMRDAIVSGYTDAHSGYQPVVSISE